MDGGGGQTSALFRKEDKREGGDVAGKGREGGRRIGLQPDEISIRKKMINSPYNDDERPSSAPEQLYSMCFCPYRQVQRQIGHTFPSFPLILLDFSLTPPPLLRLPPLRRVCATPRDLIFVIKYYFLTDQ